jgi:alkaline phosphatase D
MDNLRISVTGLLLAAQSAAANDVTIAFGSCLRQWKPVPILDTVRSKSPTAFIFTGDNVYTDAGPYRFKPDPGRIGEAYRQLASLPEFKALRDSIHLFATWDDHDYGRNDAGREYRWKAESKQLFMDFHRVPADSPVRERPGVYSVEYLGEPDQRIQILLLDTRYFRDALQPGAPTRDCPNGRLEATVDSSTTVLGEAQWRWLEAQLREPAAVRLIVSSIQVIPDEHCYEKWGNFPHERRRLLRLLGHGDVGRSIIISGDRHLGEVSMLPGSSDTFPLYEITASGLNSAGAGKGEHNRYRLSSDNVRVDHFGVVRYSSRGLTEVELILYRVDGSVARRYTVDYASWQLSTVAE